MEPRISKGIAGLMIVTALIIDIIELVLALFGIGLIINRVITILAWGGFWFWFKTKNVKLLGNRKRRIATIGGALVGFIPVIGALPVELTVAIGRHVVISRIEDAKKAISPTNIKTLSRINKKRAGAQTPDNIITPKRTRQETIRRINELPKTA